MKNVAVIAGIFLLTTALSVALAGTKTINNTTANPITITIVARTGVACANNGTKATVKVGAGKSGTITYGATFMDSLTITSKAVASKSVTKEIFVCTATGGVGTLDNAFNANSIFEIGAASGAYGLTFTSHN